MSTSLTDLPVEILETILLQVCENNPTSFWRTGQTNHRLFNITRNLLASNKHGNWVAKKLVHFALSKIAYVYVLSKYVNKMSNEFFDHQKFMLHSLQWAAIQSKSDKLMVNKPNRIAKISRAFEIKPKDIQCVHRYGQSLVICDKTNQKLTQTTLDMKIILQQSKMARFSSLPFYRKHNDFHDGVVMLNDKSRICSCIFCLRRDQILHRCEQSFISYDWEEDAGFLMFRYGSDHNPCLFHQHYNPKLVFQFLGLVKFCISQDTNFMIVMVKNPYTNEVGRITVNTMEHLHRKVSCVFMTWNALFIGTSTGEVFAYHLSKPENLLEFDWKSYFWIGKAPGCSPINLINFEYSQCRAETPEFVIICATDKDVMWWRIENNQEKTCRRKRKIADV